MSTKENAFRQLDHVNFLVERARLLIKSGEMVPLNIKQDLGRAAAKLMGVAIDVEKSQNFQKPAERKKAEKFTFNQLMPRVICPRTNKRLLNEVRQENTNGMIIVKADLTTYEHV